MSAPDLAELGKERVETAKARYQVAMRILPHLAAQAWNGQGHMHSYQATIIAQVACDIADAFLAEMVKRS